MFEACAPDFTEAHLSSIDITLLIDHGKFIIWLQSEEVDTPGINIGKFHG